MAFLAWYDDNPKKMLALKIDEAIDAYVARLRVAPTVLLLNPHDYEALLDKAYRGLTISADQYVNRNNFFVGTEGRDGL